MKKTDQGYTFEDLELMLIILKERLSNDPGAHIIYFDKENNVITIKTLNSTYITTKELAIKENYGRSER